MKPRPHGRLRSLGSPLYSLAWIAAILTGTWHGQVAVAQQAPEPIPGKIDAGFAPGANVVQEVPSRPQLGPLGIDPLVQLSRVDGEFEIIAGTSRLLTLRTEIAREGKVRPLIAAGSQQVIDFDVINSRVIRIVGRRIGTTDLTILTDKNEHYVFRIHVVYDMETLRHRIAELFPDATINMRQSRETIFVSGEVRDVLQMRNVIRAITSHINAEQTTLLGKTQGGGVAGAAGQGGAGAPDGGGGQGGQGGDPNSPPADPNNPNPGDQPNNEPGVASGGGRAPGNISGTVPDVQVINLLKIPGSQQVLLKVVVAEVNRTAFRQLGFSFTWGNGSNSLVSAPQIGTSFPGSLPLGNGLTGGASLSSSGAVFPTPFFAYTLAAMRANSMARVLAEPNLTTLSGHPASFLSGGQIPVPTPQGGAGATLITITFKDFGTRVEFTPVVLDRETIRLTVTPEVSAPNFTVVTSIAGTVVPSFLSRRASATVEMREGQTMAMAGLLQMTQANVRTGPPILSDVPYVGALFRDTQSNRAETELLISVTPYLVEAMNPNQVPRRPGDEINEPNDLEAYLLGRIEGRTGRDNRSTTKWDDPIGFRRIFNLEKRKVSGVVGFSE